MNVKMNLTIDAVSSGENDSVNNSSDYYYNYDNIDYGSRALYIFSQPYYIIAMILGTAAIFANILSLAAIYQIRKSMTSHFRILMSLIASDLLVDISLIGHIINTVLNPLLDPGYGTWEYRISTRCSFMVIKALNTTGLNITLLNLMAMAIDNYIAILWPFKLHSLMSKKRTIIMICIIWTIAGLSGFSDFFSSSFEVSLKNRHHRYNLCELIWLSPYQEEYITFAIVVVCFVSMSYMYLHLYCEVKGKHFSDTLSNNKGLRNKKALITTLLILGTFILCWLPISIFNVVLIIITKGGVSPETVQGMIPYLSTVDKYLYDLMLLNTLCDPIIYAVRMNEVRRGYNLLLARCLPKNIRMLRRVRTQSGGYLHAESCATFVTEEMKKGGQGDKNDSPSLRNIIKSSQMESPVSCSELEPLSSHL